MNTEMIEAAALFLVFFIVDIVLLRMIIKKKPSVTPLSLQDQDGNTYTVYNPGKIEISRANAHGLRKGLNKDAGKHRI